MNTSSVKLYNSFAKYYRHYSEKRTEYINGIDEIIVQSTKKSNPSMLDIGAGDGVRGYRLSKKLNAKTIEFWDNSPEMINKCVELGAGVVRKIDICADCIDKKYKYDVIVSLWNVFGHIVNSKDRLTALVNIKNMLAPEGFFYMDVSNRYNLENYGWRIFLKNILIDILMPTNSNGNIRNKIDVGSKKLLSINHVHNSFEIEKLIRAAGLVLQKKWYVDYKTGQIKKFFWQGQILLQICLRK